MDRLQKAIEDRDLGRVEALLLEEPSWIDGRTEDGVPLALHAAWVGSYEVVKYIVEYSRASLDLRDDDHRGMLHYATLSGDVQRCRYLVERCGMSATEGDRRLVSPYELAYRRARGEAVEPCGVHVVWPEGADDAAAVLDYYTAVVGVPYEEMYHNPIRSGCYPDPSILRVGDDYYMVNSSFIYFPCIPISHSRDLIHWEIIGYAITEPEWARLDTLEGGRGYWAPDISYDSGRYYITATYRRNDDGTVYREQVVVWSERPEGPYSEPSIITEDGIDPSLFHEEGRHYMLLNRGARILELSEDCSRQIGPAQMLYYGSNKHAPEGSHLLKKDGYYYLFQAEGGTGPGHRETVARSRSLLGLYEPCPFNPILSQTDPGAGIQRCGHGKPVSTPEGEWYMVYLCGRMLEGKYSILGRETALDPMQWTADGWPMVNHLQGPSVLQRRPRMGGGGERGAVEDVGKIATGRLEWMTPRAPQAGAVCHREDGSVRLLSGPAPLSEAAARNILLRRQQHFDFRAWARLALPALSEGQEAGLVCYYDENTWVALRLYRKDGAWHGAVREHIGKEDIDHEAAPLELCGAALQRDVVTLRCEVETHGLRRSFRVYDADAAAEETGALQPGNMRYGCDLSDVYYLCDEGIRMGKRFTGAMVGVYGVGGEPPFAYVLEDFAYQGL